MMKTVLAFGDSLTWGFEAGTHKRHGFADRWPNAMAARLNGKVQVIEEGLNGRTTVYPDPTNSIERRGSVALPICLASHQPLDLVIIMLGTNDIKFANRCRAFDAALGLERLIHIIRSHEFQEGYTTPEIMIVAPPHLMPTGDAFFNDLWGHAVKESKNFADQYKRLADEMNVHFFDAARIVQATEVDGGHLDADNTRKFGEALAIPVQAILGV